MDIMHSNFCTPCILFGRTKVLIPILAHLQVSYVPVEYILGRKKKDDEDEEDEFIDAEEVFYLWH